MTLYAFILFSHIAGAFFLFAGLALEWAAISFLLRDPDPVQTKSWVHIAGVAPRFYGPAIGIIFLSGTYQGMRMKAWGQGWIGVALVTLFVIGSIGLALTGPRIRAAMKTLRDSPTGVSTVLRDRLHDPMLLASVRLRIVLVLGVLLLMVSKVNLPDSLVIIACATAIGMVMALSAWRRSAIRGARALN